MERIVISRRLILLSLTLSVLSFSCTHQMVTFMTIPDKADISINGIPWGKAPVTVKLVTDAFATDFSYRRHEIIARMDGYQAETLVLQSPSYY